MNTLRHRAKRQLGVSLIEALVALAVMAIGMLGIVGVQTTLRSNSDVAKQRSEALRLAQVEVEKWRSFVVVGSTGGVMPPGYDDIASGGPASAAGVNTTFWVTRTVTDLPDPRKGKALTVEVNWTDRTNDSAQQVRLSTVVAGIAPEFAATMVVGGGGDTVGQTPKGRNRGIPITAKDLGNGTSGFIPPGTTGVAWVFNNATGLVRLCTIAVTVTSTNDLTTSNVSCGTDYALLLSGYVHYSIGSSPSFVPPSATNYDTIPPEASGLLVAVNQVRPLTLAGTRACLTSTYDAVSQIYFCVIPVLNLGTTPPFWSGDLQFAYASSAPSIATADNSLSQDERKVCRYHPAASYSQETRSLLNQNYLVIRAGNGSVSYSCPPPPETLPHVPLP
jgi:Prokaryotic N-terminal methylation motif